MTKNVALLNETMNWINLHPEQHNQGAWGEYNEEACETTMCFAGHAAILAGGTFDTKVYMDEFEWNVNAKTGEHVASEWVQSDECPCCSELAEGMTHVADFAAEKLGLSDDERTYLFSGTRTREELNEAVEKFSQGYTVGFDYRPYQGVFVLETKEEN